MEKLSRELHTESQAVYNDHLGLFLTYPFLFENGHIFSPLWCTVHRYFGEIGPQQHIFSKTGGGGGGVAIQCIYFCHVTVFQRNSSVYV